MSEHTNDLREAWNRNTSLYHRKFDWSYDEIVYSTMAPTEDDLHLLGDVKGKHVLEVGCGGGQSTIAFAKRGAIATGIDLADEQVLHAKATAEREGVNARFYQADAEDLSIIPDCSQQVVFSANVLDYVEHLDRCFQEVFRVLVDDGIFVFCVLHPFYRFVRALLPDPSDGNPLARKHRTDLISYHQRGRYDFEWTWAEEGVRIPMHIFRRTVADLLNTLVAQGFVFDRLVEPEPDPRNANNPSKQFHPYEHLKLVPEIIIVRAHKPPSGRVE